MDQTSTYTNLNAQPRTATARLIFPSALLLHLTTMLHTQTQGRRKLPKVGRQVVMRHHHCQRRLLVFQNPGGALAHLTNLSRTPLTTVVKVSKF